MTTSRIYAYRWPARLVSHKPFAAESYSITPSCIWQVFFRKKNEFSFLFSPFCQRAHFLCKMHNPQAFLPVENSAAPAVQCLVWAVLPLLYIYNKRQGRSTAVLALSVKACRLCQLSQRESPWQCGKVYLLQESASVLPKALSPRGLVRRSRDWRSDPGTDSFRQTLRVCHLPHGGRLTDR